MGGLLLLQSPVVWPDGFGQLLWWAGGWPSNCRTVSSRASWRVSHVSCVCSTGWALSKWTTRGGKVLEMRAHATCMSPSNLSGRTAILRKSLATTWVTSQRWSCMKATLPMGYGSAGSSPNASPRMMRRRGSFIWVWMCLR